MPVSTGSLGEPRAKRCKLCDESNHRSEPGSGFWQLQLDRDLVDTISAIYPEWFQNNMAEGGSPSTPRESPPKAVIDTSPLHIDQNKESLKVKLMLRRPFDQLVAQGIMPPHKTPAAFHGQRRQLERAKTGDMLKAKIQQRPPRQELERRHILEADPGHVDPSLAERQRMLKKARLADQLNDQLSHRPGPLELIQKNILHTEEPIEQAVKTGRIPYKATSEGQLNRPQHPQSYVTPEDDSQSSEGDNIVSPGPSDVLETAAKSAGIVVSLIPATEGTVVVTTATPVLNKDNSEIVFADLCRSVAAPLLPQVSASSPASLVSSTSTLSPLSSVASPVPSVVSQPATPAPPPPPPIVLTPRPIQSPAKSDAPGKDKNRKKSKSKSAPKARTIKFHEYKGPPSAQKNSNNNNNNGESSYDLLLQQQTLLLQFQLQLQHKYPQIILPASQKTNNETNNNNPLPSPSPSTSSESSTPARLTGRLEDMKVSDLKAELKRRSLPVSGSKPQLIERLKPFTGSDSLNQNISSVDSTHSNSSMDQSHNSPQYQETGSPQGSVKEEPAEQMEISDPRSPLPQQQIQEQFQQLQQQIAQQQQNQENSQKSQEEIVREQQRQIEELQRELTLSKLRLQEVTRVEPKAQLLALQKHLQARQQQQQHQQQQQIALQMQQLQALQARQAHVNEEQQRIQQQQHVAFQNQKNMTGGLVLNGADAALVFNLMQGKAKVVNGHVRTNSLPSFLNSIVPTPVIAAPDVKPEYIEDVKPPPPLYEEATKQINKKNNVKSQTVDDVLEILIKNGELPPSAAQDPSTPGSAGTKTTEPVFPNSPEAALGLDPTEILDTLDNLDNMDFTQFVMELGDNQQHSDNNNMQSDHEQMSVPMDTDDWLESLCVENGHNGACTAPLASQEADLVGYDPLLGITQDPFDPFNLEEFQSPADLTASLSWDKVDYAA
ncbi:myocardin-related transcription factor B isoform X1 [Tribolium castaneum]|uniref:myocardin-related transcription factor B isoform X1 n=3 Tax=Tribolium castaneum TaxID=7070 RepID=UPI0001757F9A|nr:PREDICTED: MKL/myocardin-like protein 2 isoform X1 [Tribolium castaneum]|eukprot:XP_973061.2 PREDICTED: MKL/myocardin-like protein 2 isoform X1 [Tribolium castaneum]